MIQSATSAARFGIPADTSFFDVIYAFPLYLFTSLLLEFPGIRLALFHPPDFSLEVMVLVTRSFYLLMELCQLSRCVLIFHL